MGGGGGGKGGGGDGGFGGIQAAALQAAQISQQATDQAIAELRKSYAQAGGDFQKYFGIAQSQLQQYGNNALSFVMGGTTGAPQQVLAGQSVAQSLINPYTNIGLPALDQLADTLGVSRPVAGSLATQNDQLAAAQKYQQDSLQASQQFNQQMMNYQEQQQAFANKMAAAGLAPDGTPLTPASGGSYIGGKAPTGPQPTYDKNTGIVTIAPQAAVGENAIHNMVKEVDNYLMGIGTAAYTPETNAVREGGSIQSQLDYLKFIQPNLARRGAEPFAQALADRINPVVSEYKPAQAGSTTNVGIAPTRPTAPTVGNGLPEQPILSPDVPMTATGEKSQEALANFYNSPQYQLLYGQTGTPNEMTAQSLEQRFQNDPGYQAQLKLSQDALTANALAKGYAYSPRYAQELSAYTQQLADLNIDKYRAGLQSSFTNYQQQLASLAGMGQQMSGTGINTAASTANQLGNVALTGNTAMGQSSQNIGAGIAGLSSGLGTNLAGLSTNLGGNIAQMYQQNAENQANAQMAAARAAASASQYEDSSSGGFMGGLGSAIGLGSTLLGAANTPFTPQSGSLLARFLK